MCWYKITLAQAWEGIQAGYPQHLLYVQPECFVTDIGSPDFMWLLYSILWDANVWTSYHKKKKRKYSPNLFIISYSRKMSSLLFLHHLFPSHPSSSHWQIPMRSEKTHLRNQTLISPPLGQPNSNGDLLFCLTNVFSPSDKSPSFSLKQPPLTLSWVLRPYFF